MVGEKSGSAAKLQSLTNSHFKTFHCMAHKMELAASTTTSTNRRRFRLRTSNIKNYSKNTFEPNGKFQLLDKLRNTDRPLLNSMYCGSDIPTLYAGCIHDLSSQLIYWHFRHTMMDVFVTWSSQPVYWHIWRWWMYSSTWVSGPFTLVSWKSCFRVTQDSFAHL